VEYSLYVPGSTDLKMSSEAGGRSLEPSCVTDSLESVALTSRVIYA
jgi:hypothetical protein